MVWRAPVQLIDGARCCDGWLPARAGGGWMPPRAGFGAAPLARRLALDRKPLLLLQGAFKCQLLLLRLLGLLLPLLLRLLRLLQLLRLLLRLPRLLGLLLLMSLLGPQRRGRGRGGRGRCGRRWRRGLESHPARHPVTAGQPVSLRCGRGSQGQQSLSDRDRAERRLHRGARGRRHQVRVDRSGRSVAATASASPTFASPSAASVASTAVAVEAGDSTFRLIRVRGADGVGECVELPLPRARGALEGAVKRVRRLCRAEERAEAVAAIRRRCLGREGLGALPWQAGELGLARDRLGDRARARVRMRDGARARAGVRVRPGLG